MSSASCTMYTTIELTAGPMSVGCLIWSLGAAQDAWLTPLLFFGLVVKMDDGLMVCCDAAYAARVMVTVFGGDR